MLNRVPMRSRRTMPTDWSLLPRFSPHWKIVGMVTNFSGKRRFDWWDPDNPDHELCRATAAHEGAHEGGGVGAPAPAKAAATTEEGAEL